MNKKYFYIILIILISLGSYALINAGGDQRYKENFKPDWESLSNYEVPEWFRDAKLGVFIHWGPYSVPAHASEWYPRWMYQDSVVWNGKGEVVRSEPSPVYQHHVEKYGHPGQFGYKDFIPKFTAEKFDANDWMQIIKKAGAKYVVPVAEHHDAFAMYDSRFTRWNAVKMGPKRDVLGELCEAGRKVGLKVGASSHFAFNWDYFNKKPEFDTSDPEYQDLYGRPHEPYTPADSEFQELWWSRTKDIIDNYQPDVLWFDFVLDRDEYRPYHPKLAAYYYNKGIEWGKEVVLQNKNFDNFESFPPGTNVLDLERGKMSDIQIYPWQTDTSIGKNSWCYTDGWESKSPNTIIDDLVDIVSKNGNLLLNIGPKADGTIPEDQKEVLFELGSWLEKNGEAIYGSRPWKVFGEGPTQVATGHHTEKNNEELTSSDFRFTTKDDVLYAIALDFSPNGQYSIKSLNNSSEFINGMKIDEVLWVANGKPVDWEQDAVSLNINLGQVEGNYACAFKIILDQNI